MLRNLGWFSFTYNPISINRISTSQSLTQINEERMSTCARFCFVYEDRDISLKITFASFVISEHEKIFELNYSDVFRDSPAYGTWRRVDEYIVDALLCWPEHLTEKVSHKLKIVGGWIAGKWSDSFVREFSSGAKYLARCEGSFEVAKPSVTPINLYASPSWICVGELDGDKRDVGSSELAGNLVHLIGLYDDLILSAKISKHYLVRSDGKAVVLFKKIGERYLKDDIEKYVVYTYADEEICFDFSSYISSGIELSIYNNYVLNFDHSGEKLLPVDCFGNKINFIKKSYSSQSQAYLFPYAVWLNLKSALIDAWGAWGISRHEIHLKDDSISHESSKEPLKNSRTLA